jgi:hypothetical protein
VVSHSVTRDGTVVVTVKCPTCKVERGRYAGRPKTHTHGWTRTSGEDGGERAPHCLNRRSPSYALHWPGGVPADAAAALLERQHEGAAKRARRLAHAG